MYESIRYSVFVVPHFDIRHSLFDIRHSFSGAASLARVADRPAVQPMLIKRRRPSAAAFHKSPPRLFQHPRCVTGSVARLHPAAPGVTSTRKEVR